jgi:transposase InsO family protein
VAAICQFAGTVHVPVVQVTRCLAVSDRTIRRWRQQACAAAPTCLATRGRPSQPAQRADRNAVYQFVRERGAGTPLVAVQAAFPHLRRRDLQEVLRRYRRVAQKKRLRQQSRLRWLRVGSVWAADFKERREPLEGRYPWILAVKDLASRCQLAWLPLEEATAEAVQATYARLFAEHGPPLVLKSDNGGQFRDERTKRLLAEYNVVPLYNPRRRPAYNGGVERANGQLAGYQEAVAASQGRPGLPTRADAEQARHLANDLARPSGWRGPTAGQLWEQRQPLTSDDRAAFLAAVDSRRLESREALHFSPAEPLEHYAQAAVDRRAVRDALVAQGLLNIEPRHKRAAPAPATPTRAQDAAPEKRELLAADARGAGRIPDDSTAAALLAGATTAPGPNVECPGTQPIEEAHSSTHKSSASGQN